MNWLIRFLVTALALWAIAMYVPGFHMNYWTDALIAAVIFGLVNAFVGTILRIISFPLTIITLGLFTIVINWALFALTVWISPGFKTTGTPPAWEATLIGAIIMMIVSTFVTVPLSRTREP